MPPAYEILLLNTAIPQIQAAQSGDTYLCPRDIAFSAALTLTAGTANGVPYLNGSKVVTTGSALTFDGTRFGVNGGLVSDNNLVAQINSPTSSAKFMGFNRNGDYGLLVGYDLSNDYASIRTVFDYPIVFSVFNAEKMRLTSTGLGIGTSSPLTKLEVNDYVNTSYTELVAFTGAKGAFVGIPTNQLSIVDSTAQAAGVGGEIVFEGKFDSSNITCFASVGGVKENSTSSDYGGAFVVRTRVNGGNLTERARITSDGNLLVGTTSALSSNYKLQVVGVTSGNGFFYQNSTDGGNAALFVNAAGSSVGYISVGASATTYNTTSDYRLKNNQQALTGSGAFIDALKPKTWDWKSGGKGVGFIAHEVAEVSPGTVVGEKDAVDADGKPIMQAMEYGSAEFIANIIAELQSLRARVAQLEGK